MIFFPPDDKEKPLKDFKQRNDLSEFTLTRGFPGSSGSKESACNAGDPSSIPESGISQRRDRLLSPKFLGFPGGSEGKEYACNAGDLGSIHGLGRSPGEGYGYPLQYSGLENSIDRGAWQTTVHAVAKSWT